MSLPRLQRRGRLAFWGIPAWERLGLRACFYQRPGGCSRGVFRGLNLGLATGDLPDLVSQNRQAALRAGGLGPAAPVLCQQVHGNRLRVVKARDAGRGWKGLHDAVPGTDGLLTSQPGLPVGIATADCLPVLLASAGPVKAVAAVHVGWRGLVSDILPRAIRAMTRQWKIPPGRVLAALGPAIGPQAFEVRGEVLERLRGLYPTALRNRARGAAGVGFDLWQAAQIQLARSGVLEKNVTVIRECTAFHPRKYFSHRRDQGKTGRMLALIQIKATARRTAGRPPIPISKARRHGNQ